MIMMGENRTSLMNLSWKRHSPHKPFHRGERK